MPDETPKCNVPGPELEPRSTPFDEFSARIANITGLAYKLAGEVDAIQHSLLYYQPDTRLRKLLEDGELAANVVGKGHPCPVRPWEECEICEVRMNAIDDFVTALLKELEGDNAKLER